MSPTQLRKFVLLLLALPLSWSLAAGSARAAGKYGDRELTVAVGRADLDRKAIGSFDLGTADGPELAVSLGWMRSRVAELGVRASYVSLEGGTGDYDPDGLIYGGFVGLRWPTRSLVSPFATFGFSLFAGDLGDAYEYGFDVSTGVRLRAGERFGIVAEAQLSRLNGEDLDLSTSGQVLGEDAAPDADALRFRVGVGWTF